MNNAQILALQQVAQDLAQLDQDFQALVALFPLAADPQPNRPVPVDPNPAV